ncbi:hypothetical protein [Spiroplasma endosymbiont of Villa modesta]|uniref:hypothetical protein n=1 Tax=Spiroplasma endosymbiont of Villa modesta TaxID=3066293 RepID=UPI00313B734F
MKQFLIALSSLTILVLTGNNNINDINNSLKNNVNNTTSLFNNKYGYLNDNDIITNQSTTDHKFYSYDTSALKDYTFANARDVFLVDNAGNLVYNPDVTIPSDQKLNIENTKQEMNSHKKITTIKNTDNEYSKSEYNKTYFDGDNNDWQYVQLGSLPNHISISNQTGGNKVEYNNSLSETLGLYYIAKATKNNQIDETIADKLGTYFMSQTSIQDNFNKDLTNKIINLISSNNNIYNFIYNLPIKITDKNNSINYIFDNKNNLIEIYYNTWTNTNIDKNNINYSYSDSYSGFLSLNNYISSTYILTDWANYAHNWDNFTKIYPTFAFDKDSYCKISISTGQSATAKLNGATTDITNNIHSFFSGVIDTKNGSGWGTHIDFSFNIWHDDHNIYWNIQVSVNNSAGRDSYFNTKINKCSFFNSMA